MGGSTQQQWGHANALLGSGVVVGGADGTMFRLNEHSTVVVSEPLDKEQHSWETVPESSLLHVSDGALSVSPLQLA